MCCGHKEYALPVGRKPDPTFDMEDFRRQVASIMAGTAPLPSVIPALDSENRPTLRRGATGELVELVQSKVGVPVNGSFDALTEVAVRNFQRNNGLAPDGIVGPRTWATLVLV
jgi:peptidoglycan hydrolase-like protein with peptidoglycan-binding domain